MRRFWKITDLDGSHPWDVPKFNYTEELTTAFRNQLVTAGRKTGAFDAYGTQRVPWDVSHAPLSFTLIGEPCDLESMVMDMLLATEGSTADKGLRKVWRKDDFNQSGQRFTWGKLAARPQMKKDPVMYRHVNVILEFLFNDPTFYAPLTAKWLSDNGYTPAAIATNLTGEPIDPDLTFAQFSVLAATPLTITIKNTGDIESRYIIFRMDSATNNTPWATFNNTTSGYQFTARPTPPAASPTNPIVSINASPGVGRMQVGNNGGLTWEDQTPKLTLPVDQADIMVLVPGTNQITITPGASGVGGPNNEAFSLLVWWCSAWRD
jgi:hypothetical protein